MGRSESPRIQKFRLLVSAPAVTSVPCGGTYWARYWDRHNLVFTGGKPVKWFPHLLFALVPPSITAAAQDFMLPRWGQQGRPLSRPERGSLRSVSGRRPCQLNRQRCEGDSVPPAASPGTGSGKPGAGRRGLTSVLVFFFP